MRRLAWGLVLVGCSGQGGAELPFSTGASNTLSETDTSTDGSTEGSDTGTKFDLAAEPTSGGPMSCKVGDDMDAVGACRDQAPPDSFEPDTQWEWDGENGDIQSIVVPMVANLTDDNADDEIDLCDVPDVVVLAFAEYFMAVGHLYVLDGATGAVHFSPELDLSPDVTPALGDIDDDGLVEIVAVDFDGRLVALEHDGTLKWASAATWPGTVAGALAVADLEADGDVEIIAGNEVYDHAGQRLMVLAGEAGQPFFGNATAVADLDGDDDQEIILGPSAFHHDGTELFSNPGLMPGFPQVADLDDDAEPEVLLTNGNGLNVLEHDGAIKYQDLRPTGAQVGNNAWLRPATVHDFDGDGVSEFAVSSQDLYVVYEADASIVWTAPITDMSGVTAGTAFDFLGDGIAEAMYADEHNLFVFDGIGSALMTVERSSGTSIEYPVVADVDNDGSAEILVTSNAGYWLDQTAPALRVIRDARDRWIQARRIWNQHTYHVTNVREDGTIPAVEPKSWELLNTYRTNAQIEAGGICQPEPEG